MKLKAVVFLLMIVTLSGCTTQAFEIRENVREDLEFYLGKGNFTILNHRITYSLSQGKGVLTTIRPENELAEIIGGEDTTLTSHISSDFPISLKSSGMVNKILRYSIGDEINTFLKNEFSNITEKSSSVGCEYLWCLDEYDKDNPYSNIHTSLDLEFMFITDKEKEVIKKIEELERSGIFMKLEEDAPNKSDYRAIIFEIYKKHAEFEGLYGEYVDTLTYYVKEK